MVGHCESRCHRGGIVEKRAPKLNNIGYDSEYKESVPAVDNNDIHCGEYTFPISS